MKFILASESPRRIDLLSMFSLDFKSINHTFNEEAVDKNLAPQKFVEMISAGKAHSISSKYMDDIILSADTIVLIDDKILEKPKNGMDAIGMLKRLSGKKHHVLTAVTIVCKKNNIEFTFCESTKVIFNSISDEEIQYYVKFYNPLDKSGSYGIQDFSSIFVKSIEGCFFNVVGLPLSSLFYHLKRLELIQFSLNSNSLINNL